MSAQNEYRYEPLSQPNRIRVLELQPGSGDDPISVSLRNVSLDAEPQFEAISYVWGDASVRLPIRCSGHQMDVTQNLHVALMRFRNAESPRYLWADALCINQQHLDERAAQVQIMHLIYQFAMKVLVWLGPADDDSRIALDLIEAMALNVSESIGIPMDELDSYLHNVKQAVFKAGRHRVTDKLPSPESSQWSSLYRFFSRPYFSRIWVGVMPVFQSLSPYHFR